MTASPARLVVLGAGRPLAGRVPSALRLVDRDRKVLDWTLHAFSAEAGDVTFVGGYDMEDIVGHFPGIRFVVNTAWAETGATGSLLACRPALGDLYVCYSDVLVRPELVRQLAEAPPSTVVVAIDTRGDAQASSVQRKRGGVPREQLRLPGTGRDPVGFVGVVRLPGELLDRLDPMALQGDRPLRRTHLSGLVEALAGQGVPVHLVDARGQWADLEDERALAAFVFGTKAETLDRLAGRVQKSQVPPQWRFTVDRWRGSPEAVMAAIGERFAGCRLAVRSSALSEDGLQESNAGRYDSRLDIACEEVALARAIEEVIASYGDDDGGHQVFVQPMVANVALGGVVLTRTAQVGGPYYTIAFTEDGSTDAVTSGTGEGQRVVVVHRSHARRPAGAPAPVDAVLAAVAEVEFLTDSDTLDIEFAVDRAGRVNLLQVRPLVLSSERSAQAEERAGQMLADAAGTFDRLRKPAPGQVGSRPAWGVMPDWNPAEIIGVRPSHLAFSLYDNLICADVWATQRAEYGYRDVRPWPLVRQFAGHAFVDVRASFNSFVPAGLPDEAAEALVEACVRRLERHPELHDKVEFEIALTSWSFDLQERMQRLDPDLARAGGPLSGLPEHLARITAGGIARVAEDAAAAEAFGRMIDRRPGTVAGSLQEALTLVDLCRRHGTLPFAHLARGGFVAVILLRSAVDRGLLDPSRLEAFFRSLRTVSHGFVEDAWRVHAGELTFDAFVRLYGHLRPGTYDVTASSYGADPERFLRPAVDRASRPDHVPFAWAPGELDAMRSQLGMAGIRVDPASLDTFLRAAIEGRERSKFVFTRALSKALDELAAWGRGLGLSESDLASLTHGDLVAVNLGALPALPDLLAARADENRRVAGAADLIELPPLIFEAEQVLAFEQAASAPNFVTRAAVVAPVSVVEDAWEAGDLSGKIVLIPRADPGYDWLFGRDIAGLVTMFGGANSHMAIRSAEFGLPAAIGVGVPRYRELRVAPMIELNCRERRVFGLGA